MGIHHFWREHPPNNGTALLILGQHCGSSTKRDLWCCCNWTARSRPCRLEAPCQNCGVSGSGPNRGYPVPENVLNRGAPLLEVIRLQVLMLITYNWHSQKCPKNGQKQAIQLWGPPFLGIQLPAWHMHPSNTGGYSQKSSTSRNRLALAFDFSCVGPSLWSD